MAETPNDVGASSGGFWSDLGLSVLNNLFGFGGGLKGTAPRDLAAKYGGVFPGTRTPAAPAPTPGKPTPINPAARPADRASVEPYRGPASGGRGRKKRKKTLADRIKDQLVKEALYYASNPVALLRVLPTGRLAGGARGRFSGSNPPSFQRGSVMPRPIGQQPASAATRARRAQPGPRAGRIGQQRPRASPKPVAPIRKPAMAGATNPAASAARAAEEQPLKRARDVAADLPFTDYDAEGLNQPSPVAQPGAQPGTARGSAPGSRAPGAGTVRMPAPAGRARALPAVLPSAWPSVAIETVLRAVTRRTPRISSIRGAQTGGAPLPIGDFPAASPTPASAPKPVVGVIEALSPFPVPQYAYDYDKCNCPKPKKRKPREPRTVCKAGSYTQTAKGIKYHPNREVPCN